MEEKESIIFQCVAAGSANLVAFTAGITLAWPSPILPTLYENVSEGNSLIEVFPLERTITEDEISNITSFITLGALLGALIACSTISLYGRKYTLLLGCMPFLVGHLVSTLGNHLLFLFTIRIIYGIGVGIVLTVLPIYIGEIAQDNLRATLGCLTQFFLTLGYLYAFINAPSMDLFWFSVACAFPVLIFITFLLLFAPESPFYLMEYNEGASRKSLQRLRGRSNVMTELMAVKIIVETCRRRGQGNFTELFRTRQLRRCILITGGLAMFQQLCGCTVCIFYMSFILKEAKCPVDIQLASIFVISMQTVVCLAMIYYMKYFEYRALLFISVTILGFSYFFLALMLYASHFEWASLFTFTVILMSNSVGLCNVAFILPSEIFRHDIKNYGTTFTAVTYWVFGLFTSLTFLPFSRTFGMYSTFLAFSVMCILAGIFILYLVPDLNQKSLREIQVIVASWRSNRVSSENNRLVRGRSGSRSRGRATDARRSVSLAISPEGREIPGNIPLNMSSNPERANVRENVLQRSDSRPFDINEYLVANMDYSGNSEMSLGNFDEIWDTGRNAAASNEPQDVVENLRNARSDSYVQYHSSNSTIISSRRWSSQNFLPGPSDASNRYRSQGGSKTLSETFELQKSISTSKKSSKPSLPSSGNVLDEEKTSTEHPSVENMLRSEGKAKDLQMDLNAAHGRKFASRNVSRSTIKDNKSTSQVLDNNKNLPRVPDDENQQVVSLKNPENPVEIAYKGDTEKPKQIPQ